MKKMKKLITLLAAMVLCINLVACGGVDTQPAVDAYNELCENYNKFVDIGNENLDAFTEEDIEFFNTCASAIDEYGKELENRTDFTQEEVDEMVEMFEEFNGIIEEAIGTLE